MFKSKRLRRTKELVCDCILLSMEEIKENLECSSLSEDIRDNADAMNKLADAFKKVYYNG